MRLTERQRRVKVIALRRQYDRGDMTPNELYTRGAALACYADCNCPSAFDMCWECRQCIGTRLREGGRWCR